MAGFSGFQAGFTGYAKKNMSPADPVNWSGYGARLSRYAVYDALYYNTIFDDINGIAPQLRQYHRLYRHIRGVYNPVARYVNLMKGAIYGGVLDMETAERGSIPLRADNPAIYPAVIQLWKWSRWQELKALYVRRGCNLGDVVLKVIDDPVRRRVRLEVVHPSKVAALRVDEVGNVKAVKFEYTKTEESDDPFKPQRDRFGQVKTFKYGEILDGDWVITLKDDEEFPFFTDADGKLISRWQHGYGFCPVVNVQHTPTDSVWGANGYLTELSKIYEINDQAALLNDQIRKVIIPLLVAAGVSAPSQLQGDTSGQVDRDAYRILYAPDGASLTPVHGNIDIAGVGANIQNMLVELERALPVLALQTIREHGELTAPGVQRGMSDAIWQVQEARGQYDGGLIRAQEMALSIGGMNGYDGFEAFNADSFAKGDTHHYIADRPVISDTLSLKEQLDTLQAADAPLYMSLEKMGYSQDEIDKATEDADRVERNAIRSLSSQLFGDDENEQEAEPRSGAEQTRTGGGTTAGQRTTR